jgi:hypothetical protein
MTLKDLTAAGAVQVFVPAEVNVRKHVPPLKVSVTPVVFPTSTWHSLVVDETNTALAELLKKPNVKESRSAVVSATNKEPRRPFFLNLSALISIRLKGYSE